jgi:hypothetical protein
MAFFTPFGSAPAMIGQNYNAPATNVTFNFDASATLDAIIGSGGPGPIYRPWNTSGGAPSVPGPLNPMIQNVANAPAWQQNTAYTSFPNDDRVLAGPAYNPGTGLFTNGQPLYLWAVASGGGGTSGNNSAYAGHFGTAPCPSSANVGGTVAPGGQTSSGTAAWNAATHVTDGGVTWVCLTSVDYNTFTGANGDDVKNWAATTPYFYWQWVVAPATGNIYYQQAQPTYPALTCTSGGTAPHQTVFGTGESDGSCTWNYAGNLGYSSKANVLPHQLYNYYGAGPVPAITPQHNWVTKTQLWWGGDARKQYAAGSGGEAQQMWASMHLNQPFDINLLLSCAGAAGLGNLFTGFPCDAMWQEFTVALGDSYGDNMNPASDAYRYDPTKGVSLFSSVPYVNHGVYHLETVGGAFSEDDWQAQIDRFMMQATSGQAMFQSECGPGPGYNGNGVWLHDNILDSGGGGSGCGDAEYYSNNLMIFRGTGSWSATGADGMFGAYSHYGGAFVNNTLVGPGISCAGCSAIESDRQAQYGPVPNNTIIANNLAVGWVSNSLMQPEETPSTNRPIRRPMRPGAARTAAICRRATRQSLLTQRRGYCRVS